MKLCYMSFVLGAIMKVTGFFAISNNNKQTCFSDGYPKGTGDNKQTYKQIARCIQPLPRKHEI